MRYPLSCYLIHRRAKADRAAWLPYPGPYPRPTNKKKSGGIMDNFGRVIKRGSVMEDFGRVIKKKGGVMENFGRVIRS